MLPWLSGLVTTVTGGLLDKVFGQDTQTATQAPSFVPVAMAPAPSSPPPAPPAPAVPMWVYVAGGAAVLVLLGVVLWRR